MSVPVSDPDAAKLFYTDVLGMDVVRDDRDVRLRWIMLRPAAGQACITLVTWFESMPMGSLRGTVLAVPDIEEAVASLRAKGALDEDEEILEAPWGRYVTVEDPDGNGWIIQQNAEPDSSQLNGRLSADG
jgi:catechol 2,3-dioxygenase-like lactoylglutathione lyase family enzyme